MNVAEWIQKSESSPPSKQALMMLQDVWSDDACYGYMIAAAEALGYPPSQIARLTASLKEQLDRVSVNNAALHYHHSRY